MPPPYPACPRAKALGKRNIRPSAAAVPGCYCEAEEQVNARAETPAVHTIGSARCQLRRLGAWGQVVLETRWGPIQLRRHSLAVGLPVPPQEKSNAPPTALQPRQEGRDLGTMPRQGD